MIERKTFQAAGLAVFFALGAFISQVDAQAGAHSRPSLVIQA